MDKIKTFFIIGSYDKNCDISFMTIILTIIGAFLGARAGLKNGGVLGAIAGLILVAGFYFLIGLIFGRIILWASVGVVVGALLGLVISVLLTLTFGELGEMIENIKLGAMLGAVIGDVIGIVFGISAYFS